MEDEISVYKNLTTFREPLMRKIINSNEVPPISIGLDAGCGIGAIAKMLSEKIGSNGQVIGLDLSKTFINYARSNYQSKNLQFKEGDINSLPFQENTFDWLWSVDTVWPGPKEFGCPSEDPIPIVKEFHRVIKPNGSIFLLFWTSQKLLPGHPILEAELNTASSAVAPFTEDMNPIHHVMNATYWLAELGFKNIKVITYLQNITAPLTQMDKSALLMLFQMFWSSAELEVDEKFWRAYKKISDPNSSEYLLNNEHYHGFYTYTLFKGTK
ncbi:MAG: class I SAM-dependent methyltransferase [Candidatus Lokiarchaeota archaeon]|nr:class I SAM-dependent methyltransferase [Candidatus Lokiarchaeota archaeon]